MRYSRIIAITLFFLLALFPAVVYASAGHTDGGPSQDHDMNMMDMPGMDHNMDMGGNASGGGHDQHGAATGSSTGAGGHDQHGSSSGGHDSGSASSGGSHTGGSHGSGGGTEKSSLEPVKNNIVAGFGALNAIVIIAALIMRKKGLGV